MLWTWRKDLAQNICQKCSNREGRPVILTESSCTKKRCNYDEDRPPQISTQSVSFPLEKNHERIGNDKTRRSQPPSESDNTSDDEPLKNLIRPHTHSSMTPSPITGTTQDVGTDDLDETEWLKKLYHTDLPKMGRYLVRWDVDYEETTWEPAEMIGGDRWLLHKYNRDNGLTRKKKKRMINS